MSEMRTLRQLRCDFTFATVQLVVFVKKSGYELAYGEVKRSNEQAEINAIRTAGRQRVAQLVFAEFPVLAKAILDNGKANGIRGSLHELGLAVDFILYKDGRYLPNTEEYEFMGVYWRTLDPLAVWGGDFGDGGHFSFTFGGKK